MSKQPDERTLDGADWFIFGLLVIVPLLIGVLMLIEWLT